MTAFPFALLVVALGLPRPVRPADEALGQYTARVAVIASAAALESRTVAEAAAVLVVWYGESTFRRDVHDGTTLGDAGRAICLGQIHPHAAAWSGLAGTDLEATRRCAAETVRHLRYGWRVCARGVTAPERRVALALESYARGHCAEPGERSLRRAAEWSRMVAKIREAR